MPSPGPEWTDDRVPRTLAERRHKRQWEAGRAAVLGWIGHPAVASEVAAVRPELMRLAAPLELRDQIDVAYKIARLLDVNSVWPDGTQWDNPYLGASEALIEATARVAPQVLARLRELGGRIAAAGAPLDPEDFGSQLVLAQIALVPIDLRLSPTKLVDGLNILAPGWIDRDAAALGQVVTYSSRYGRSERFKRDLSALAEAVATELGPPPIRPPYAGGKKRATPRDTARLRLALADLVARYPSLTPRGLLDLVQGGDHPALLELRRTLDQNDGWDPDLRRLERNWPKSRQ